MKIRNLWIWLLFFVLISGVFNPAYAQKKSPKIYVIPISGTVEPAMAAYVKRVLDPIKDEDAVFVFKMDTFGGRVDAALEIVEHISAISKGKTIAFVEKRAISAGALIALSSNLLFMKDHTIIGDCAPIISTGEGQKMAGEKIQTVLRAKFRALAKKNNYPSVLAESMVSVDMAVYRVEEDGQIRYISKKQFDDLTDIEKEKITRKKTIVAKGELLTMDDVEAKELGFSQKSVQNLDQVLDALGLDATGVVKMEESWSETLVRFLQPFLPVLMLIGIGALYTEIKAPGFGLPGILGVICLGLVFFNQYLVGLADVTEVLLLLIGALLIGVEVFVLPGFGAAGISGIVVIAAGLVLAFQNFVIPDPSLPWEGGILMRNLAMVLGSFLGAFLVSLFTIRFILPRISKVVKGPYLDATLQDSHVAGGENLGVKKGDKGRAHTFLRPSGKVVIDGRKIDAISQSEFIKQGKAVIVERIEGNKVIVKPEN